MKSVAAMLHRALSSRPGPSLLRILVAWIALAAIGPDRLDRAPPICPHRVLTGEQCAACGLGRGLAHTAQLDLAGARDRHPWTLVVAGLGLIVLWRGSRRSQPHSPSTSSQ